MGVLSLRKASGSRFQRANKSKMRFRILLAKDMKLIFLGDTHAVYEGHNDRKSHYLFPR